MSRVAEAKPELKKSLLIKLTAREHKQIKMAANVDYRSMASWIRKACQEALKNGKAGK